MSPNDMEPYRTDFYAACTAFGWVCHTEMRAEGRDASRPWEVDVWRDAGGAFLFLEEDLSEGLVKELIRLSKVGLA